MIGLEDEPYAGGLGLPPATALRPGTLEDVKSSILSSMLWYSNSLLCNWGSAILGPT